MASTPVAISTGPQKMDVFYYDKNKRNMLWQLHYDGTLLSGPQWQLENVGQILVATPMWPLVVASWADNVLDVFKNFANGQIADRSQR